VAVPGLVKFSMAGSKRVIELLGQLGKYQEGISTNERVNSFVRGCLVW
jgi:hypothetical protein